MSDSETAQGGGLPSEESEITSSSASPTADVSRRGFIDTVSNVAMAGGLIAGYGTFFVTAGRFLYPSRSGLSWLMVGPIDKIKPGGSISFESPAGESVVIRRAEDGPTDPERPESEFLALSSVCPHLGCRVHWEPQNNRFFCPCHNGVFDPEGVATEGPPAAEGQILPDYSLMVQNGLLFIEMLSTRVGV